MKVVQINVVCGTGSTGKICVGISKVLNAENAENYIIYNAGESDYPYGIKCAERFPKLQALKSRVLGNYGFNSKNATKQILKALDKIQPDVVHLHNLHGHNCNLEMLFSYLRLHKIKVVWTFHDCWAFTAYCPHFVMAKCDQWKTGCQQCVQRRAYSWFFDRSSWLYEKKKAAYSELNMVIVTPSQWLAELAKESMFRDYPIEVIHNGIDLNTFKPTESNFRKRYGIPQDRFVLLGVAIKWTKGKGMDVLVRLAEKLDPEKFQIVMVGTDDQVDQLLPKNVISIHRTADQKELAEIYSAADLFVNPTREENYPTVNMEALACGTPVVTFRTGGSPEIIDEKTGIVVDCDDEEALYQVICQYAERPMLRREDCLERAKDFDMHERFREYAALYGRN